MTAPKESFGSVAASNLGWSVLQHWGGRGLAFLLFLILARFLTPTEFGLASAAMLVLFLVGTLAEFGFADAIVQRRDLASEDINLPFLVSLAASTAIAALVALNAGRVEDALGVVGLTPVLIVVCTIAPIVTLSNFQEMNFRRAIAYRPLALRVFIANVIAGPLAILAAATGWGVWSLVVQAHVAAIAGCLWLWTRPMWKPGLILRWAAFIEIFRTGSSLAAARLLDFSTLRFLEVLIVSRYGAAAFGLYAVGARYQTTLAQLIQSAVSDVGLSMLSRISGDTPRLARLYVQSARIMSRTAMPAFVCAASLSTDLCDLLLGSRWEGTAEIARPLLLLGAVQSLQFINAPYLMARGKSPLILLNSIVRTAAFVVGMTIYEPTSASGLVVLFCWTQVATTPVSFIVTATELRADHANMMIAVLPPAAACLMANTAVSFLRPQISGLGAGAGGLAFSSIALFLAAYAACLVLFGSVARRRPSASGGRRKIGAPVVRVGLMWHTLGHSNLGIDALARGHIALLSNGAERSGIAIEFVTLGGAALVPPSSIPDNVTVGPSPGIRSFLHPSLAFHRAVRTCDVVFDISEGDSFTDIYGGRRFLVQCLSKLVVLGAGVPLVLAPQTIGPFENALRRRIAIAIIRMVAAVYTRGTLSTDFVSRESPHAVKAEFTDVAFALPYMPKERLVGRTRVAINVSGLMYHAPAADDGIGIRIEYRKLTSMLIDFFEAVPDVDICLFAHVRGSNDCDDDAPAVRNVAELHPRVTLAPRFECAVEAKSYLSGMDFVVSGRMHACIAALSVGVPVVPIAYSRKFAGLFTSLDYHHVVDGKTVNTEEAFEAIVAAFERRAEIEAAIPASLAVAGRLLAGYEQELADLLPSFVVPRT